MLQLEINHGIYMYLYICIFIHSMENIYTYIQLYTYDVQIYHGIYFLKCFLSMNCLWCLVDMFSAIVTHQLIFGMWDISNHQSPMGQMCHRGAKCFKNFGRNLESISTKLGSNLPWLVCLEDPAFVFRETHVLHKATCFNQTLSRQ